MPKLSRLPQKVQRLCLLLWELGMLECLQRKPTIWIETDDTVYVLGPTITKEWLNVTLHGTTKIAIEGRNAHILDDAGKDKKMPIAEKVARTKPEGQKLTAR
jgi:hypothetical protein